MHKKEKELPPGDYVSPGLEIIMLDSHFPNMIKVTDASVLSQMNIFQTRAHHHNHYADKRQQNCGFVNRDEAHILYNTALRYRDKNALEIGCWLGWSACHLLSSGIHLDVIDPLLKTERAMEAVSTSINSAGLAENCQLWQESSPNEVAIIARSQKKSWSVFFIDGNHQHPGPVVDAFICTRFAEPDAIMLFHDLWCPAVVEALDYMKEQGWNTMLYNTFAIMGVAWRGNMEPVKHIADPAVTWTIPDNLKNHPVSS